MREERTVDLRYPYDTVWDAASQVLQKAGWTVSKADRSSGRFEVRVGGITGLHDFPWTGKMIISLSRNENGSTRVQVGGIRRMQLHWGTTRVYLDSFLYELEKALEK